MREKWKALTKRERLLFAAALVFLALAVLLRFVPGLRFSALLCLCAAGSGIDVCGECSICNFAAASSDYFVWRTQTE